MVWMGLMSSGSFRGRDLMLALCLFLDDRFIGLKPVFILFTILISDMSPMEVPQATDRTSSYYLKIFERLWTPIKV